MEKGSKDQQTKKIVVGNKVNHTTTKTRRESGEKSKKKTLVTVK